MPKVLIVDDDVPLSEELAKLLQKNAYSVEVCHDGEDALQIVSNFRFDLIILDNAMPGLTGLDVCKKFRDTGGKTPIIFLSGHSTSEVKSAGLDLGADDYIVKPFDPPELLARLRAVLRRGEREPIMLLSANGINLDIKKRVASCGEFQIQLTQTETNVLEFFFRNRGSFFSAKELF